MAVVFDTENVPDITLYSSGTPNGIKIPITLEELGYDVSPFDPYPLSAYILPTAKMIF